MHIWIIFSFLSAQICSSVQCHKTIPQQLPRGQEWSRAGKKRYIQKSSCASQFQHFNFYSPPQCVNISNNVMSAYQRKTVIFSCSFMCIVDSGQISILIKRNVSGPQILIDLFDLQDIIRNLGGLSVVGNMLSLPDTNVKEKALNALNNLSMNIKNQEVLKVSLN